MKADSAYNSEMYPSRREKNREYGCQEDYAQAVYDEWVLGKEVFNEHQCEKPAGHKHHSS